MPNTSFAFQGRKKLVSRANHKAVIDKATTPRKNKTVKKAKATEDRHDKFRRLGVARMNKALTSMRLLGQLSSANYKYTDAEVAKMAGTLMEAVDTVVKKFSRVNHREFQLH